MVKFQIRYDQDKEIEYLNEMSEKGYALTGFKAGFYFFDECEKGKYVYQIDTAEKFGRVSTEYREFMSEQGIEIVCVYGPWVILRKLKADGEFELFSDVDSKIEHYKKTRKIFKVALIIELIAYFIEVFEAANGIHEGFYFAALIGFIILVFCFQIFKVNKRMRTILEENGRDPDSVCGRPGIKQNVFLLMGYLLYFFTIGFDRFATNDFTSGIFTGMKLAACVSMLIGIYMTSKNLSAKKF